MLSEVHQTEVPCSENGFHGAAFPILTCRPPSLFYIIHGIVFGVKLFLPQAKTAGATQPRQRLFLNVVNAQNDDARNNEPDHKIMLP